MRKDRDNNLTFVFMGNSHAGCEILQWRTTEMADSVSLRKTVTWKEFSLPMCCFINSLTTQGG